MAYSNGFQTVVQSMNGTLSFNDGNGTIIENGTITTQSIAINNLPAVLPTTSVSLWNNLITANAFIMNSLTNGTIYFGTALSAGASGVLNLGNTICTVNLGSFTFLNSTIQTSLTTTINLFTTYTGVTANLFTAMTTGTLNLGIALGAGVTGILNLGNTLCTVNLGSFTFLNSTIQTSLTTTLNLFTTYTGATANLFTAMTTGTINLGTSLISGATGILNLGNTLCTVNLGSFTFLNSTIQTSLTTTINLFTTYIGVTANLFTAMTTGTINLGTSLGAGVTGILNLGNTLCTVNLGSFTFLNSTIQTSLTTTINLFTTYIGVTANLFTAMTTGTINLGTSLISGATGILNLGNDVCTVNVGNFKFLSSSIQGIGGAAISLFTNINYSTANLFTGMTTGIINIGTGMTGTASLNIGSSTSANKIGSLTITNNQITSTTSRTLLREIIRLGYETVSRINPASLTVTSNFISASDMNVTTDFICGGSSLRNYDVRQIVETNGAQAGDGRGVLKTIALGTHLQFNSFSQNILPSPDPNNYELKTGYYSFQDDTPYIAAGAPYGGISFGGCGLSNPIYNATYQRAMTVYPYYGLRLYTGGLNFDRGNLTSAYGNGRGFFIQTGLFTATSTTTASQGIQSYLITFPTAFFGVTPIVTCNLRNLNIATSFVLGINVITTSFTITLRNVSNVSVTGTIAIYYTAIGPY